MSAAKLVIAGIIAAGFAGSVYKSPNKGDVEEISIDPNGSCPSYDAGVVAIPGGRPGTCFRTTLRLNLRTKRASIEEKQTTSAVTTDALSQTDVMAIVQKEALDRADAMEPYASNPDLYERATLADLDPIVFTRPHKSVNPSVYVSVWFRPKIADLDVEHKTISATPFNSSLNKLGNVEDTYVLPVVTADVIK